MNNQEAIALIQNSQFYNWTKHINIQWHFIHYIEAINSIKLTYILTDQIIADSFTKPLLFVKFRQFVNLIDLHINDCRERKETATNQWQFNLADIK